MCGLQWAELSDRLSSRSLQIAHNCLVRAIRHAEAADLVGRNVAALVRPPVGREGRPSKALSLEHAQALVAAAASERHPSRSRAATHACNRRLRLREQVLDLDGP
jgi:hypothetical protein